MKFIFNKAFCHLSDNNLIPPHKTLAYICRISYFYFSFLYFSIVIRAIR